MIAFYHKRISSMALYDFIIVGLLCFGLAILKIISPPGSMHAVLYYYYFTKFINVKI